MAKEVEHKFLVQSDAWRSFTVRSREIRQGYLAVTGICNVRVRRTGDRAVLTIKGRRDHDRRTEFEYDIPVADADEMIMTMCATSVVEKRRHDVPLGALVIEIDEFRGLNAGLVLAEIELPDGGSVPSELPEWLGADVTDDERYYNAHLSRAPYSQWKSQAST